MSILAAIDFSPVTAAVLRELPGLAGPDEELLLSEGSDGVPPEGRADRRAGRTR